MSNLEEQKQKAKRLCELENTLAGLNDAAREVKAERKTLLEEFTEILVEMQHAEPEKIPEIRLPDKRILTLKRTTRKVPMDYDLITKELKSEGLSTNAINNVLNRLDERERTSTQTATVKAPAKKKRKFGES